ncbi:MAG: hypothetical protein ACE14L_17165 [Terriglobales bacterium]
MWESLSVHTLVVVGLSHRTATARVRDRFWISESRLYEALTQLKRADGIEEVVIISTAERTEFVVWASDTTAAANSVPRFLTREFGLRLCEWERFYRKLDDEAVAHVLRVVCGLDSSPAAADVGVQVRRAWQLAEMTGAAGAYLSSLFQRAFALQQVVAGKALPEEIEQMLAREAAQFRANWAARPLSRSVALEQVLEQIGREEVQAMRQEVPEWTLEQQRVLQRLAARITQKAALALARESGSAAPAVPDAPVDASPSHLLPRNAATASVGPGG